MNTSIAYGSYIYGRGALGGPPRPRRAPLRPSDHRRPPAAPEGLENYQLRNGAVAALGTAAGAGVGTLAGVQAGTLAATAGGAAGLVGGFATGFLAGSTLAGKAGADGPLQALAGTVVGLSSAAVSAVGGTLLGGTSASPAAAVVLAVLGGVGGYLAVQPFMEAPPRELPPAPPRRDDDWVRLGYR